MGFNSGFKGLNFKSICFHAGRSNLVTIPCLTIYKTISLSVVLCERETDPWLYWEETVSRTKSWRYYLDVTLWRNENNGEWRQLLTPSMEWSPSREANSSSASQKCSSYFMEPEG